MIIAEIRTASGVTVRVHDDCMAPPGSEEERRAIEAQRRAAHNILINYMREAKSDGEHGTD